MNKRQTWNKLHCPNREILIDLYKETHSFSKIAEHFNVSRPTVSSWFKQQNIQYDKGKKINNHIGEKYGKLTILSYKESTGSPKRRICECKCECGNTKIVRFDVLCKLHNQNCGKCEPQYKKPLYRGYEELTGWYWSRIIKEAYKRKIPFEIEIKYAWDLFILQNKQCKITGIKINFIRNILDMKKQTASLDRIDSSKGYIEGNVQWVHKRVNWMKGNMSLSELINWCNLIINHN